MKHFFLFAAVFYFTFEARAQFTEIPLKFSSLFQNAAYISSAAFDRGMSKLEDNQWLTGYVDSLVYIHVFKTGNTIVKLCQPGLAFDEADYLQFLKTTLAGDTLEQIVFRLDGKIIFYKQNGVTFSKFCRRLLRQQFTLAYVRFSAGLM